MDRLYKSVCLCACLLGHVRRKSGRSLAGAPVVPHRREGIPPMVLRICCSMCVGEQTFHAKFAHTCTYTAEEIHVHVHVFLSHESLCIGYSYSHMNSVAYVECLFHCRTSPPKQCDRFGIYMYLHVCCSVQSTLPVGREKLTRPWPCMAPAVCGAHQLVVTCHIWSGLASFPGSSERKMGVFLCPTWVGWEPGGLMPNWWCWTNS